MKSYVTIAVCPICHKETGELLLDRRLRNKFNMHTVTPNPCDKCKEKYLKKGVMLINPQNGRLAVIKTSAFKRIFNAKVPTKKIAYTDDEVLDKLGVE